jgi:FKBP-type peptidyl-prolyl cis-trans isomerase
MIKLHYTGFFEDGKIFDSSVERGEPAQFPVGQGGLIKGFEEGLMMMQVGDKYHLVIPYNLAYGEAGFQGVIPPKANLIFDIEVLDVIGQPSHDGHDHSDPNHKH